MPDHPHTTSKSAPTWATWAISMVNGLAGDYLHEHQNGLAIDMAFYERNRVLPLTREAILQLQPAPTANICILVHGLGCHEGVWSFPDPADPERSTSYGALLRAELGYTPFFVRYNSGLSIAENGAALARLLDELAACYPLPIESIILIGHSMGGLLLRSTCHSAGQRQAAWLRHVRKLFYLGTPHDGAVLAKLGHLATTTLHAIPNPITRLIGDIFNWRSQGIKDLRFGMPPDISEPGAAPNEIAQGRQGGPWLAHAQHYLIVGALTDDPRHAATVLFGDGLVHLPQADTQSAHADQRWPIPGEHIRLFPRTHHLRLAHDPGVYQQIKSWCTQA